MIAISWIIMPSISKAEENLQTVSGGTIPSNKSNLLQAGDPLVTIAERLHVYGEETEFDVTNDWDDQGEFHIGFTTDVPLSVGAIVTMDVLLPKDIVYNGIIKLQGVARIGSNWDWVQAPSIPELAETDFKIAGEYKKASVMFEFGDNVEAELTADKLSQFTLKLAGYLCDYKGNIYVENIKLYDGEGGGSDQPLPPTDDSLMDDFENENIDNWKDGDGWQYENGVSLSAVDFNGSKMLKIDLDYTGMDGYSWSEAKVDRWCDPAYNVSAYNSFQMDFYYPAEYAGNAIKIFAKDNSDSYKEIINKEAVIEDVETLTNGYKKAKVSVSFKPSETPMQSITIGFVGKNTTFKGSVYIDNLTLLQVSASGEYVKITSIPGAGTTASLSNLPTQVKLTDKKANDSVKALYAYLQALSSNNQVLFGHQNDYNKKVSESAAKGDVYDITGSLSGMYGIDTLSLTGAELGITDATEALNVSVAHSIAAANEGAIVTLSAHMPNFTNAKITKNADGSFNFTSCDFSESKDLSGNSGELILPGGEYNPQFNAYLDIIAAYADGLQTKGIPVIFRPFHECDGSWFWWGAGTGTETYKSIFRYTVEYLQAKGIHNMLYVYSPNGPVADVNKYLERYPGDEYVDILAFDYYDDYSSYPATADGSFFTNLENSCKVVSEIAKNKGKVAAISETGARVMKKDGSDNEGLLVSGNPITQEKSGVNWYQKINDIADANGMPYYLVWANFGDTNFYVPYKYNDTLGHELINDFIDYYNSSNAIFANGTNFYGKVSGISGVSYDNAYGYMIAPFERAVLKSGIQLRASVANASDVKFLVVNPDTGKQVEIKAVRTDNGTINEYGGLLTLDLMNSLGKTDQATIYLMSGSTEIAVLGNISLLKDKDKAAANIIENFDFYLGSNDLLKSTYVGNSAGGCSSGFTLDANHKADGAYGGGFHYLLKTTGKEVWTGQVKSLENNDYSAYNAITMWVKPDGKGQKLVVQIADDSGEEFEVYLSDFVKGTEAKYVTIPFSSFKGKKNGTLDASAITKFAIWCNSIVPEGHTGEWEVDSVIYFDGIQAIKLEDDVLNNKDKNGLVITEESLAPANPGDNDGNNNGNGNTGSVPHTSYNSKMKAAEAELKTVSDPDYYAFNNDNINLIKKAEPGSTLVIDTSCWVSFHKSVYMAISARADIAVTINYKYQGKYYTVTIPAGADVMSLINEEGFCGFRNLDAAFGGSEITK